MADTACTQAQLAHRLHDGFTRWDAGRRHRPVPRRAAERPPHAGLATVRVRRPRVFKVMRCTLCRAIVVAVLSVSALASAACAARTVNQVLADPSRYRDREVRLSGRSSTATRSPIAAPTGSMTGQASSGSCPTRACPARARGSPSTGRFVRDSILAHWAAGSTCRKELDRAWR
jgi:hypothetical protein